MGDLTVIRGEQGRFAPGTAPGPGPDTIYSQEIVDTICHHIRNGTTMRYAVLAAGISHDTIYRWMQEKDGLSDVIARAQADWMVTLSSSVTRAAVGDPEYKGDPKTALRALELRDKVDWGPSLEVKRLDDDTLLRLLRASQDQQPITEDGRPAIVSGEDDI